VFKWIYNKLRAFLFDEQQFERMGGAAVANIRAALMAAGLSSVAFSEQIAALIQTPEHAAKIKLGGVLVAGIAMMFRAGEKNPPPPPDPLESAKP
jgi:hypothetical protein